MPSILAVLPPDFFSLYWRRKPLVLRGALSSIVPLVTEEELEAFEHDYSSAPAAWRNGSIGRLGSTSYIANGECINERLARMCSRLREDFKWPHAEIGLVRNREAQSWVTSGPHFDQVDNFITQAKGAKQWRLWPAGEVDDEEKRRRVLRLPQYGERPIPSEPVDLIDVVVEPGDLLYVPLFWGHTVRALESGIMFSITLKALLPSQVLLRGMARQLGDLAEDSLPLAIPPEVPDWDAYLEKTLDDAFSAVARRLAPRASTNGASAASRAAAVAALGVADIASSRHESLVRSREVEEPTRPSAHTAAVAGVLERSTLDLRPLAAPRLASEVADVVDVFAAVHLHRFLALLSLGPQRWWPANQRDGWAEQRSVLDAADPAELLAVAADPTLVELTTDFRNDLLAFNRRFAVRSLGRWVDRFYAVAGSRRGDGATTFLDAACTMPAEPDVAARVDEGVRAVDQAWPGFGEAFSRVSGGVAAVRNVWQARQAAQRPRIVVVDAAWTVEEMAAALPGEVARAATQLVERIGAVMPTVRAVYRGAWRAPGSELPRVAALLATASYHDTVGDSSAAERQRRVAAGIADGEAEEALTPIGADLLALLRAAATGGAAPSVAPIPALSAEQQLEALEPEDVLEFVEGHTVEFARFRWSKLGSPEDQSPPGRAGLDCGVPPWVVP